MTLALDARHVRLVTERTVDCFLQRLFLRDAPIRTLCIVSPFIGTMEGSRFTLCDLSEKIRRECIPTYVVTRSPSEPYQHAILKLSGRLLSGEEIQILRSLRKGIRGGWISSGVKSSRVLLQKCFLPWRIRRSLLVFESPDAGPNVIDPTGQADEHEIIDWIAARNKAEDAIRHLPAP